jgi:hypothetical protein
VYYLKNNYIKKNFLLISYLREMTNGGQISFLRIVYFASLFLVLFESFTTNYVQLEFNVKDTNCSLFNLTNCDYCGPGAVYNSSKFFESLKINQF